MKDYYKILGVDSFSLTTEIKKTFRQKAKVLHPDKSKADTKQEFIDLYEAYCILIDKKKRERYDSLYKLFFSPTTDISDQTLKSDLIRISEKGQLYADNYIKFNREVLALIVVELFFGTEGLLWPSLASIFFGLWTLISGIMTFNFPYLAIGTVLTTIGLLLGKRKLSKIKDYVEENAR